LKAGQSISQFQPNSDAEKLEAEENRGLNPSIADIKIKHATWGTLYVEITRYPEVIQFAWKDNNVVLFMSTIHTGLDVITRNRKRPKKGDAVTKRTWDEAFEMSFKTPSEAVFKRLQDFTHGFALVIESS